MKTLQPDVSVSTQKVMFSSSACLLHLFEISSANDQNWSELMLVCLNLCHLAWVLCNAYAIWHGFFPELVHIGMASDALHGSQQSWLNALFYVSSQLNDRDRSTSSILHFLHFLHFFRPSPVEGSGPLNRVSKMQQKQYLLLRGLGVY